MSAKFCAKLCQKSLKITTCIDLLGIAKIIPLWNPKHLLALFSRNTTSMETVNLDDIDSYNSLAGHDIRRVIDDF